MKEIAAVVHVADQMFFCCETASRIDAAGAVVADRNGSLVHISLRRRLREFNQDFVLIEGGNLLIPMSGRLIRDLDQTALLQFLDMTCQRAVGDFQAGGEIVHIHVVQGCGRGRHCPAP